MSAVGRATERKELGEGRSPGRGGITAEAVDTRAWGKPTLPKEKYIYTVCIYLPKNSERDPVGNSPVPHLSPPHPNFIKVEKNII